MKVSYSRTSRDDVTQQVRYYVRQNAPKVAIRFKEAVRKTAQAISEQPRAAPLYQLRNPQLQNLRSWPVTCFEDIRVYFLVGDEGVRVIRILHGRREVRGMLEREWSS